MLKDLDTGNINVPKFLNYVFSILGGNSTVQASGSCNVTLSESYYGAILVGFCRLVASIWLSHLLMRSVASMRKIDLTESDNQ